MRLNAPFGHPRPRWNPRSSAPRLHWVIMAVLLVTLTCVLLVNGLINSQFGADHRVAPATDAYTVPDAVIDGGPIIDMRGGDENSYQIPDRTVVLTFDDGPDPVWTPQVLEVLKRHDVPATFFVVGNRVAQDPGLVTDIVESGSELGIHTFTHPDLAYTSSWRRNMELSEVQLALAGAAGRTSTIIRPPYSSTASAVDDNSWPTVRDLGADGYLTVLTTHDTKDWARPGVDQIVNAGMPDDGRGGIVLLHDAGGDRSQTVAALDRLIPELQDRGYTFSTVADIVGRPSLNPPAGRWESLRGEVVLVVVGVATVAAGILVVLMTAAGVLVVGRILLLVILARRHARRVGSNVPAVPITEPVSIVVPAYNERECIADTVRSLVNSDHPVEVIVVDDGSTDGTADVADALGLPDVTVVRRPNGGKPAALNTGIAHARHELIVMMDGDTVFGPDTVRRLVQRFADPLVGAVAGNAKVANRAGLLGRWQHIEYVIGFNIDRRAYDVLQCMPTIPGAVGAFRRQVLREVGGVSADTLAEDTDLTMAVSRGGWRVVYEPRAVAWTEAPSTLSQLWRQRYRWSYGTIQAWWKHRRAIRESGRSGRFGRIGLLNVGLFQILLPLLAPLMDVFLVYGLLFLDPVRTLLAWLGLMALQGVSAVVAFRLDREPLRPLVWLPLQQIVYRQLMYAVVIQSVVTAVTGVRLHWQKLRRVGGLEQAITPIVTESGERVRR